MSEWKEKPLSDLAILYNDSWKVGDEECPYIALEHIEEGKLRLNGIGYSDSVASNKYRFNGKNFLFGKLRPYFRKVVRPQFSGICSTDIWVVGARGETDLTFLFYLFANQEFIDLAYSGSSGTRMPRADWKFMKDTVWLIPSDIEEQRAIASMLSSLDDKIDLLHRQNKTLEAMAETLFRQWFVEEADEEWETARVGDFVRTNVASINKDNALKTIRYLDTGSLTEGKIDGYQTFDIADAPSRARRIVKHNDVLISTVRPNQKHYGILKNPAEDVIVSTGFCVITCDKINPHFIYILLTTDEMTEYLHSIAEGSTSTYPSLKPSDIEGLEFQLPPQEKLDAFSEYADNGWSKIEYNHTQIRTLEKLRDTLLPKLMSGEVKVENENN